MLPILVVGVVGVLARTILSQHAWLADLAGLLIAYSGCRVALTLLQLSSALEGSVGRWLILLLVCCASLVGGWFAQRWLWPPLQFTHPTWLLPSLMLGFVVITLAPEVFKREIQRQADKLLQAEQSKLYMQKQLLEARMAALQGQIEPHFLYNTLANARTLIRQDAAVAEHMLNQLITYLRAAMPDLRAATTTLGQELERADAYLQIMQIRFGQRLQFVIDANAQARACLIPPLGVMTLIENAIQHGIEPKPAGGRLQIGATCQDGKLVIDVIDNGMGFQQELGDGIGLLNLQERLQVLFGDAAELDLQQVEFGGVHARICMPVQNEEQR